jgi:hypothetical protein
VGSTISSPKRVGAIVVGCMLLIAVFGAVWTWRPWDARMGTGPAARALQQRLHTKVRYQCEPQTNDGTIKLDGVDYLCRPIGHPSLPGYWIATNRRRITGMLPTG